MMIIIQIGIFVFLGVVCAVKFFEVVAQEKLIKLYSEAASAANREVSQLLLDIESKDRLIQSKNAQIDSLCALRKDFAQGIDARNSALDIIMRYGGIDGDHHKAWVLDQVVRRLLPNEISYKEWVAECKSGDDGPDSYRYDEGIAP